MANEKNIILYLPFDESKGSKTAFDYSANRADGGVNDADFVSGKVGNAIEFNGLGSVDVSKEILTPESLNQDWTVMAWVKPGEMEAGSPSVLVWTVAMAGVNKFVEKTIPVQPGQWSHVVLTKRGPAYKFYLNTTLIDTIVRTGEVTGLSLFQDYFGGEFGKGCVDDMKVFDVALSAEDIVGQMSNVKVLEYYIDGVNLKDYGVRVSDSKGLVGRTKAKKPRSESWDDYHGVMIDLRHKYVEERTITLSCYIKTENGKGDYVTAVNKFSQLFDKPGTVRLMIDIHPTKPLVYEVYLEDPIDPDKTWNDGLMVGVFQLKLKEPNPVKRVLKYMKVGPDTMPATIKMTTRKMVDVYWGDGTVDHDVSGEVSLSHDYQGVGDYYIVVAGCIEEIGAFETNSIVVWEKI